MEDAGPASLTLAVSRRYRAALAQTRAGAAFVAEELADAPGPATRIVVDDPARAMAQLLERLVPDPAPTPGIDPTARIGPDSRLGEGVSLGPWVVIGRGVVLGDRVRLGAGVLLEDGVEIGDDSELAAHCVVYRGVVLGRRVRAKAGAVLGGAGFGFRSDPDGHRRVPHVGGLRIGDDVEIGSGCTIDRGTLGDTIVGRGTKLDNLVHIGHNSRIGEHCIFAGGAMVAGSVRLGDFVVLGGGSGVVDHVSLGAGVRVGAISMVTADVPAGATVSGIPAHGHRETLRMQAASRRLPDMLRRLESLLDGSGDA